MEIVIQDPSSTNNPDITQLAAFTVLRVQKEPYQTLEQVKDKFIQSLIISGANIAPTNVTNKTVAGINATEVIYIGNSPKYEEIQLKLIYFEENNMIYIMAFLTRGTDLQSHAPYFDMILNSFKLQ
ncbi:MAG: PsbP-related protein [Methanobacteriaceae archaeon]